MGVKVEVQSFLGYELHKVRKFVVNSPAKFERSVGGTENDLRTSTLTSQPNVIELSIAPTFNKLHVQFLAALFAHVGHLAK